MRWLDRAMFPIYILTVVLVIVMETVIYMSFIEKATWFMHRKPAGMSRGWCCYLQPDLSNFWPCFGGESIPAISGQTIP